MVGMDESDPGFLLDLNPVFGTVGSGFLEIRIQSISNSQDLYMIYSQVHSFEDCEINIYLQYGVVF